MLEVIRFLESMGANQVDAADYAAAVSTLELDHDQKQALLDRNHSVLNDLIGGRSEMFFGVLAPDEEQPDREQPLEDEPREPDEAE
jgi:hypothetical protein